MEQWPRAAWWYRRLITVAGWLVSAAFAYAADPVSGLTIAGENGNIRIGMDRETAAMASIRRNENRMIIRLPADVAFRPAIDPELEQNGLVREEEGPAGRTITIQSQRIFLEPSSTGASNDSPASTEARTGGFSTPRNRAVERTDRLPAIQKLSSQALSSGLSPSSLNHGKSRGRDMIIPNGGTEKVTGLEAVMAVLRREVEATAALAPQLFSDSPEGQNAADTTPQQTASSPPTPLEAASDKPKTPPSEADPEKEAVRWPDGPGTDGAGTGAAVSMHREIPRLLWGLLAVLALATFCLKRVLPALMQRYPDFFKRMGERSPDWPDTDFTDLNGSNRNLPNESISADTAPPDMPPAFWNAPDWSAAERQPEPNATQFEILSSVCLEADKTLHLVSIGGKRLVIATTPYMTTLLRELTPEPPECTTRELPNSRNGGNMNGVTSPPEHRKGFFSRPGRTASPLSETPPLQSSRHNPDDSNADETVIVLRDYEDDSNDDETVIVLRDYEDTYPGPGAQ